MKTTNLRWKIAQAAEIRWWQRYLNKRPKAAYLNWKRDYWKKLLQDIEVIPSGTERMLDAGCGPAGIFTVLEGSRVDAIDPLLDDYQSKLEHFDPKDYPGVSFHNSPLESFQTDVDYDIVFCLNAINHVSDLENCFENLARYTTNGGTLVISIDAHNFWGFKRLFRLLPGDILHPHQYDLKEYKDMLCKHGFSIRTTHQYQKGFFFDYYVIVADK